MIPLQDFATSCGEHAISPFESAIYPETRVTP